jgi:enoyl-CoA hydratase/carnithine racemase
MDSDGTGKALEWLLRGRLFSPEEAAREGLVHHFMPSDVLVAAREMAKEFLDKPARALASVKQPIRVSANQPLVESPFQKSSGPSRNLKLFVIVQLPKPASCKSSLPSLQ